MSDPAQDRLIAIATNLLDRAHGHLGKALAHFSELIDSDRMLRHALASAYLTILQRESEDKSANRDGPKGSESTQTLAISLSSGRGGQRDHETRSHFTAPVSRPPRGVKAISSIQTTLARSVFDTFKVRDGRSIGDVKWHELRSMAVTNETEARVLRYLSDLSSDTPPESLVRAAISESALNAAIAQAQAVNDAA